MIIFLSVVLAVYFLVNYYVFKRGYKVLPQNKIVLYAYAVIFFILSLSYIAGKLIEHTGNYDLARMFVIPGAFWLAAVFYFFLFVLLIDIVRSANHFFHFFPDFIIKNKQKTGYIVLGVVIFLTIFIVFFGYVNANEPIVNRVYIKIDKKVKNLKTLRIAAVSDLHAGIINGKKFIEKLTLRLEKLRPDIILLVGDILDESTAVVMKENMLESFETLHPYYGIWAVTGNHEYYSGVNSAVKYMKKCGIKVLRDNYIFIDNKFYLIGRDDRSKFRITGKKRKKLQLIMQGIDLHYPVILMDHQPVNLDEAGAEGIDLQISGHTHSGQIWPLNLITDFIYELNYGELVKGNTHYYVSSGYGTWGPPIRTGNTPEIVILTITLE